MGQQLQNQLPTLKELVKNNTVHLDNYRQGHFYFQIKHNFWRNITTKEPIKFDGPVESLRNIYSDHEIYQFTVPIDDIGTATIHTNDKALTYMRWIRKAIEDKTLIKI